MQKFGPRLLILAGVVLLGGAFGSDLVRKSSTPGFGTTQWMMTWVGLAFLLVGGIMGWRWGTLRLPKRLPTPKAEAESPWLILQLAVLVAIVAGLVDVAVVSSQVALGWRFVNVSRHAVWMAPLSYGLFLLVPAIVFMVAAAMGRRGLGSLRLAVFVFVLLGALGALLNFETELNILPVWLLAVGVATQAARSASRHGPAVRRIVRRGLIVAGVVLLGASVGLAGVRWAKGRPGPQRATADAPNVLLIILDTVRAASLSLYGYERQTSPMLDSLASSGVVFDRAIAPSPWTLPTHVSVFTGRYPHDFAADWQEPFGAPYPTLAEVLRNRGYLTAGFVANRSYTMPVTGLGRGFSLYDADLISASEIFGSSSLGRSVAGGNDNWRRRLVGYYDELGRKDAEVVNRQFLDWLSRTVERDARPFFVFLNYFDAHDPYLPPEPYDSLFHTPGAEWAVSTRLARPASEIPDAHVASWIDAYDGAIAYLDAQLGALFDELNSRGILDNTLLIVASDHGEEFGEHGVFTHGRSLYLPALHVPLLLSFPGAIPARTRVAEAVTLRDIPATVADLLGFAGDSPFPGESLSRHWTGDASNEYESIPGGSPGGQALDHGLVLAETSRKRWMADHLPVWKGDMLSVFDEGVHYIRNGDGQLEVFDVVADPLETVDLVDDEDLGPRVETAGRFLDDLAEVYGRKAETARAAAGVSP